MGTAIAEAYRRLAREQPQRPALKGEGWALTRAELERRSNQLARAYLELGVERDSFVTIGLPNGPEFVVAALAAWKAGATPQPISSRLPARERDALLRLVRPSLAVGIDASASGCPVIAGDWEPQSEASDEPLPPVIASAWKAPTSGGSTGRPKLIVTTKPATEQSIAGTADAFLIQPADVVLITGPLYHNAVFSSCAAALMRGATVVVMDRFDPAGALRLLERERVSWMYAVPTMMHRIWRLPQRERIAADVSSLRIVYHVGAPCPRWLKRAWIDWLGPDVVWELYGGTEAQAWTRIGGREWLEHEGSVGKPVVGEIKVLGPELDELPPGEVGKVWMRPAPGQGGAYRYVGATANAARQGWESLGDHGYLDAEGYLYLTDRESDMFVVGGANVYPAEVEAAIDEHPAVLSCCVIGLPDDDLGNIVHALVELSEEVADEDLRRFLAERIARYKLPRSFERVDGPLRDEAGKVRRAALREQRLSAAGS